MKQSVLLQVQSCIDNVEVKYQLGPPPLNPFRDYRIRPMKPKTVTKKDNERLMQLHALKDNLTRCECSDTHYNKIDITLAILSKEESTVHELQAVAV